MIAQLIPVDGGSPITLKNDITVVGRKSGLCDLIVDRNSISKLHCLLVKTDGLLFVRDLGSTNGTKVNGQRVTRGALLPGDELSFASSRFRVHLGPDQQEPDEVGSHEPTEMIDNAAGLLAALDEDSEDADQLNDSDSDVRLVDD